MMTFRFLRTINGVTSPVVFQTYAAGVTEELMPNFVGSPSAYFVWAEPQDGITAPADFNKAGSVYIMNARETCTFAVTTVAGAPATELTFATEVPSIRGPLAPLVDRLFVIPNLKKQTLRELEWMKGCLETK